MLHYITIYLLVSYSHLYGNIETTNSTHSNCQLYNILPLLIRKTLYYSGSVFIFSNLPLYLLITLLYEEGREIPTQVKMVKEGKLKRHQRKQTTRVQGQLQKLWDEYGNHEITTNTLLKKCARLYGPY